MPEPQQRQIRAVSVTYTTVHGNAGSLTHWARPGIKPATTWFLVRFVSTELWWKLQQHCIEHIQKCQESRSRFKCYYNNFFLNKEKSEFWLPLMLCEKFFYVIGQFIAVGLWLRDITLTPTHPPLHFDLKVKTSLKKAVSEASAVLLVRKLGWTGEKIENSGNVE